MYGVKYDDCEEFVVYEKRMAQKQMCTICHFYDQHDLDCHGVGYCGVPFSCTR